MTLIEGSFEVKLPTIWTDEKQSKAEAERRGRLEERRSEEKRKSKRTEDTDARKGRKVAKHCVFPMIWGSGGSKSRLAKRRVRSQLARGEMKNCTPLWREAHFEVKMYKTPQCRTTLEVEMSKKCTPLWREAHLKSKRTKHLSVGRFLEVEMSKKCTPLWREAHFEVKMYNTPFSEHFWKLRCRKSARRCGAKHILKSKVVKNWRSRTTFGGSDVEKVSKKCTPLWREAHFEVKSVKTEGFEPFLTWRCRKSRHWLT